VIRRARGGPGQYDARLARAEQLLAAGGSATAPLNALVAVLQHQRRRAVAPEVVTHADRLASGAVTHQSAATFPMFDVDTPVGAVDAEVPLAVAEIDGERLPEALRGSGDELVSMPIDQRSERIAAWLEDPGFVAPPTAFWFRVAAGPLLELAAAMIGTPPADTWQGSSCPLCGAPAQASVIAEESGEFMGGSPRNLVCARCATWWSFPRATCPICGQDDPRSVSGFLRPDNRVVRIDGCETCHGYVKTFDLRQVGARDVVPLVDDVATLSLDLWAQEHGFERASVSFSGA
jgi:FdhE protein